MINLDHYQKFNGNNARKLLKKVDVLQRLMPSNIFIPVFNAFNIVVSSCFGQVLNAEYKAFILHFIQEIQTANIHFTPKLHIVAHHIIDFCEMTGRSLGFYSEQASEQVHHLFNEHSKNFTVNNNSPTYAQDLLRSVCVFNSRHQ